MKALPQHLQKYIVDQDYEKYTSIDHACWRFIMRQLRAFLTTHAHESYPEGLKKTGIEIERIPKIQDISNKLEQFGWRALPVSGFIPPAAFMELQSLSVLPIASDMRTLDHLLYTPAPDIVHEAAGHAPILVNQEFADYLRAYAQVAKKAIISKEDMSLYEAIRDLSDIKEHPHSTEQQVAQAQARLDQQATKISHISEAAELSRMNWWTAEYGLIGDINNPKIYGAGLLSSVGESRWCLSDKVKKIPLSVDCLNVSYDITEPQPQLFVTPDFKTLISVLEQMADKMAFRTGGYLGVKKAIQAGTVNTAELDTGIQISGLINEVITDKNNQPIYLRTQGPTQLCYQDQELPNHGRSYHKEGFGTALGSYKPVSLELGQKINLEFDSGISVQGQLKSKIEKNSKLILLSFSNCTVRYQDRLLFEPSWGIYDMAVGQKITSVFGGAADRLAYGEMDDFIAKKIPARQFSADEKRLQHQYSELRKLRETSVSGSVLEQSLRVLLDLHKKSFQTEWLLFIESLELVNARLSQSSLKKEILDHLEVLTKILPEKAPVIKDGLALADQM